MASKAEITSQYILETVSPVFNRNGYAGTSMSDLTKATGLTKGAIYGNFKNKDELALEAFNFNIRRVIGKLSDKVVVHPKGAAQLQAITDFYREYYEYTIGFGGCPVLNVGIDANHTHPELMERVHVVIGKLINNIANIIRDGQQNGEFREGIEPDQIAGRIFAMIQGSIFQAVTLNTGRPMLDMMDHIDRMIANEMKA
ncbi:MAG: TetR/AcrR family transcriptional regulator [Bacteroidia bacterium]|nr:TetR/AcrR family transcriptional regulator [Bacteroidia bacterium]